MKKSYRGFLLYAVIILAIIIVSQMFGAMGQTRSVKIDYNTLLQYVEEDRVAAVAILDETLVGLLRETSIAQVDFPARAYDFETTIDKDNFFATVRQIYARKLGKPVDEISEVDFAFDVTYLPQPQTPWFFGVRALPAHDGPGVRVLDPHHAPAVRRRQQGHVLRPQPRARL